MARKKTDEYSGDEEEPDFEDPEGFVDDITDEGRTAVACVLISVRVQKNLECKKWTRKHFVQNLSVDYNEGP